MSYYEIMYIVPLKLNGEEPTAVQDKVRAMLQAEGAKITKEEPLGKRKLAYPIKHIRHGAYVALECELEPTALKKVNEWFRLSSEVLRVQILSKQPKTPEQLAREKAFQEKLAKLHAKAEAESKEATPAATKPKPPTPKVNLEDLDKKLEKILEEEIVK